MIRLATLVLVASMLLLSAAQAGNILIAAGAPASVARSALEVTPDRDWNRLGARPGRKAETWTLDGDMLNDLTFYGGIADGEALFRKVDKRNKPLPRFRSDILLTDVVTLLENSYRIAIETPLMSIDAVEPASFAGARGVKFTYRFAAQEGGIQHKGEAHVAIVDGRLYMITFEAPRLHYFDAGIGAARAVVNSATVRTRRAGAP